MYLKHLSLLSRFALLLLLALAVGCGKTPRLGEYVKLDERPVLCAPDDRGLVYFIREDSFWGCGISYYITENKARIGALENASYFVIEADVGAHTYSASTSNETTITVDVEAGQVVYIIGGVSLGAVMAPSLAEVTEDVAMRILEDPEIRYLEKRTIKEFEEWRVKREPAKR